MTVNLPDDAARRVAAEAARRGVSADQVVAELVVAGLPAGPPEPPAKSRFSFIGMGHSGRGNLSERVKELRRELADDQLDERRLAEG